MRSENTKKVWRGVETLLRAEARTKTSNTMTHETPCTTPSNEPTRTPTVITVRASLQQSTCHAIQEAAASPAQEGKRQTNEEDEEGAAPPKKQKGYELNRPQTWRPRLRLPPGSYVILKFSKEEPDVDLLTAPIKKEPVVKKEPKTAINREPEKTNSQELKALQVSCVIICCPHLIHTVCFHCTQAQILHRSPCATSRSIPG